MQRGLEAADRGNNRFPVTENTLHQVLNEIARNGRIELQAKLEEEYEKGSPLSSFWLMLFFGGAVVLAIVVTLVWHFYSVGKAL